MDRQESLSPLRRRVLYSAIASQWVDDVSSGEDRPWLEAVLKLSLPPAFFVFRWFKWGRRDVTLQHIGLRDKPFGGREFPSGVAVTLLGRSSNWMEMVDLDEFARRAKLPAKAAPFELDGLESQAP